MEGNGKWCSKIRTGKTIWTSVRFQPFFRTGQYGAWKSYCFSGLSDGAARSNGLKKEDFRAFEEYRAVDALVPSTC